MPVSFATAALGGALEIPTLEGKATLKIPAETQTEKMFRLRGKGVRNVRSGAQGDLFCRIRVETPVNLNKKQKELLREFDEQTQSAGHKHRPKESGWTDKIKSFIDDLVS